jgi:hypothetical protein
MQPAENHERPARAVVIRDPVGAVRVGYVHLNDHEIGTIIEIESLDVLVDDADVEVGVEVRGQGGEPERRKERVLDGAPVGTGRLGQRGQDQFDATDG